MPRPRIEFTTDRVVNLALIKKALKAQLRNDDPIKFDVIPTGLEIIDNVSGGLLKGAITEIVGSESASGLFIDNILSTLISQRCYGALVDSCYCFSPDECNDDGLRRLLWVACKDVKHAIKATDILLHDENLPLIVLDLPYLTHQDFKHIQASVWHRFQRLIESKNTALVVLSKRPVTAGAKMQVVIKSRLNLNAMSERRYKLMASLKGEVVSRHQYISDETFQNHIS